MTRRTGIAEEYEEVLADLEKRYRQPRYSNVPKDQMARLIELLRAMRGELDAKRRP